MSNTKGAFPVFVAFVLSLVGLAVSAVLLQHHVAAQIGGDPLLGGACTATATASCDEVIASKWGKLELGDWAGHRSIPTAWFGLAFFACTASWFALVGRPRGPRRWMWVLPIVATGAGTAGCAMFAYVMYVTLEKWCPLCALTHFTTLALFIVSLAGWVRSRPGPEELDQSPAHPTGRLFLATVLVAGLTALLGYSEYRKSLHKGYSGEYFARWQVHEQNYAAMYEKFLAQPLVPVTVSPNDPVRGPADAPHTLIVFSDFACPFCKGLSKFIEDRRTEYPGQFRVVFKHFPLDNTCNDKLTGAPHPGACAAAVVAEAARLLKGNDTFWAVHDGLFAPEKFSAKAAYDAAAKAGIGRDELMKRVQTYSVWNHIKENVAEGNALGLKSTPVMYFDGRRLEALGDKHTWKYLLSGPAWQAPTTAPASAPATAPVAAPATNAPILDSATGAAATRPS